MQNNLVIAAEYLTYREGLLLYQELAEQGVKAWIKTCGPPALPFMEGTFFWLWVEQEEFEKVRQTIQEFMKNLEFQRKSRLCRYCRSEAMLPDTNLSWFNKLRYAGTEVYKCSDCGKRSFF